MVEEEKEEEFMCKEGPVIMPDQTLLEPSHQKKWKNTLIGKLHVTEIKTVPSYHVIRDINNAWTDIAISNFTITELGNSKFGFHFKDERDMKWVMDHRPWLVSEGLYTQYILLLTEWCPNTPPFKIKFSTIYPFWIQAREIPYEYVSREMGKKIGEGTGHEVLDIDYDGGVSRKVKWLRIRILVDVYEKLATGCWLLIEKNQPKKVLWVPFKYEELPTVCYKCGVIGHSKDSCGTDVEDDDAINYNPQGDGSELPAVLVEGQVLRVEGEEGYGPWLYEGTKSSVEYEEDDEDEEEDEDYDEDGDSEESENNVEDFEGLVDEEGVTLTDSDESDSDESDSEESDSEESDSEEDMETDGD